MSTFFHNPGRAVDLVTNAVQVIEQQYRASIMMEKMRAAIIMQAWIDGYEVHEYQDEIVLT